MCSMGAGERDDADDVREDQEKRGRGEETRGRGIPVERQNGAKR